LEKIISSELNELKIPAVFGQERMAGIICIGFQIISGDCILSIECVSFELKS
jgi:hypothetical protein